jgi:hypothetical protein
MANSGTLISTISMTSARNAMAVDDCIGRLAPSNDHRGRLRQRPLLAQFLGLPTGKADHIGGRPTRQCQLGRSSASRFRMQRRATMNACELLPRRHITMIGKITKSSLMRRLLSLRALVLLLIIAGAWLALQLRAAKRQSLAVETIRRCHGWVGYDSEEESWLTDLFGVDFSRRVVQVELSEQGSNDVDARLKKLHEYLVGLSHLKRLSLESTSLSDAGLECTEDLNQIECLDLSHTSVTDAGLKHLRNLTRLAELDLNQNEIYGKGLEQLSSLRNLRELNLTNTPIADDGLKYLEALIHLRHLSLESPAITDAGLAHIGKMTGLRSLYIAKAAITGTGFEHLKGLTELQSLHTWGVPITDARIVHLKELSQLRNLLLYQAQLTRAGVKDLRLSMPRTEIEGSSEDGLW